MNGRGKRRARRRDRLAPPGDQNDPEKPGKLIDSRRVALRDLFDEYRTAGAESVGQGIPLSDCLLDLLEMMGPVRGPVKADGFAFRLHLRKHAGVQRVYPAIDFLGGGKGKLDNHVRRKGVQERTHGIVDSINVDGGLANAAVLPSAQKPNRSLIPERQVAQDSPYGPSRTACRAPHLLVREASRKSFQVIKLSLIASGIGIAHTM